MISDTENFSAFNFTILPQLFCFFSHPQAFMRLSEAPPGLFHSLHIASSSIVLAFSFSSSTFNHKKITSYKPVLRWDLKKASARCGLLLGHLVHHFVEISREAVFPCTATLGDSSASGKTVSHPKLHNRSLLCSEESSQIIIDAPEIQRPCETLPTPTLSSRATTCRKGWAVFTPPAFTRVTLAQCVVSLSASLEPAPSAD